MFTSLPFAFWRGESGATGFGYRYGYDFDGIDEKINFGNVLDVATDQARTISFWFKTSGTIQHIFANFTEIGNRDGYSVLTVSNKVRFLLASSSTATIYTETTNTYTNDEWNHISITYTGSELASGVEMYLNGVQETVIVLDDDLTSYTTTGNNLTLGSNSGNDTYNFTGRLDDVQYYDFVLNATQVSDIYNNGYVTPPTASPIHHWKLGEDDTVSTNWTVKDSVGSLDGTSVNLSLIHISEPTRPY